MLRDHENRPARYPEGVFQEKRAKRVKRRDPELPAVASALSMDSPVTWHWYLCQGGGYGETEESSVNRRPSRANQADEEVPCPDQLPQRSHRPPPGPRCR